MAEHGGGGGGKPKPKRKSLLSSCLGNVAVLSILLVVGTFAVTTVISNWGKGLQIVTVGQAATVANRPAAKATATPQRQAAVVPPAGVSINPQPSSNATGGGGVETTAYIAGQEPILIYPSTLLYVVEQGDTLASIAANLGTTLADILAVNPQLDRNNPAIYPGLILQVPLTNGPPQPTPGLPSTGEYSSEH